MRAIAAAVAAAALLGASGAQAQTLFPAYEALCVKLRAEPEAILSAASAAGWMPMPKTLLAQLGASGQFKDVQGRLRSSERSLEMLVLGRMEQKLGAAQLQMRMCGVAAMPPDPELKAQLATWAGVPPSGRLSRSGRVAYVFTEEDGVRRGVDERSASVLKLIRDRRVYVAAFQEERQLSMAMFAVPTTSESP